MSPRHVLVAIDGGGDPSVVSPEQLEPVAEPVLKTKARKAMEGLAGDLARQLRARGTPTEGLRYLCQDLSPEGSPEGLNFSGLVPYESDSREPWRGETVRTHDSGSTVVRACYGSYTCPSSGLTLFAVRCGGSPPCVKRRRVAASK